MINKIYTALIVIMSGLLIGAIAKMYFMEKDIKELTNANLVLETSNQTLERSLGELKKRNAFLQANEDKRKKIRERVKEEINYSNLNLEDVVAIIEGFYEK